MLALFVQNGGLVSVACTAMADMAYIIPDLVLPLVHERFEVCPSSNFHLLYACHSLLSLMRITQQGGSALACCI